MLAEIDEAFMSVVSLRGRHRLVVNGDVVDEPVELRLVVTSQPQGAVRQRASSLAEVDVERRIELYVVSPAALVVATRVNAWSFLPLR